MEDVWMCCWLMQFSCRLGGEEIIFDFVGFSRDIFTAFTVDISLGIFLLYQLSRLKRRCQSNDHLEGLR